jgi:uncharacterized protein
MGFFQNPHLQTIIPAFFRPSVKLNFNRQTIKTSDDDFLDLDYYEPDQTSTSIAVIIHGLEGSSLDSYITNTAKRLEEIQVNSLCMNLRSCSGRTNNLLKTYHSGKSEDLREVIESIRKKYITIYLIGFSIGGNIVLKYLGENSKIVDFRVKQAFAISPPIDLESSANALAQPETKVYMQNLLKNLKKKVIEKTKLFPGEINYDDFDKINNFYDYDTRYTASLNCFSSAKDYWQKASSRYLLENIKIPTIILSALDDPFLGDDCFPKPKNKFIETIYTKTGGHLGFMQFEIKTFKVKFLYEETILRRILEIKGAN